MDQCDYQIDLLSICRSVTYIYGPTILLVLKTIYYRKIVLGMIKYFIIKKWCQLVGVGEGGGVGGGGIHDPLCKGENFCEFGLHFCISDPFWKGVF